jgi:hypothetical protein
VTVKLQFHLQTEEGFQDAFEIAKNSVEAWERFLYMSDEELTAMIARIRSAKG